MFENDCLRNELFQTYVFTKHLFETDFHPKNNCFLKIYVMSLQFYRNFNTKNICFSNICVYKANLSKANGLIT